MSLIAHWPLNASLNDTDGDLGLNGTGQNNPGYISDVPSAISFTNMYSLLLYRSSEQSVVLPNFSIAPEDMSLSLWFKTTDRTLRQRLFSQGENYGNNFALQIENNGVRGIVGREGTGVVYTDITSAITNNTWYHVALVFDQTTIRLYLNGSLANTRSSVGIDLGTGSYSAQIGNTSTGIGGQYMDGQIDDVRLFDHALTASEVSSLYAGNDVTTEVKDNSGGLTLGGSSAAFSSYWLMTPTGGLASSGTSEISDILYQFTPNGGLSINGSFTVVHQATGGLSLSGSGNVTDIVYEHDPETGASVSGSSLVSVYYNAITSSGGLVLEGSSVAPHQPTGGISLSGQSIVEVDYIVNNSGGMSLSGNPDPELQLITSSSGGLSIGGEADLTINIDAHGGVSFGGTSNSTLIFPPFTATGGLSIGGEANLTIEYSSSGRVSLSGSSNVANVNYIHNASGGLEISGDASPPIQFNNSIKFKWEFNKGKLHYYRVESKCIERTCPPISDDDTCGQGSRVTVMVLARSLSDVCIKLSNKGLLFPIEKIDRLDPPALFSERESTDDNNCTTLVDVTDQFNQVADCVPLFIDFDLDIAVANIDMYVDESPLSGMQTGSGGLELSGSSDATYTLNPSVHFVADSHDGLTIGGSSTVYSPVWEFTPSGGLALGGDITGADSYLNNTSGQLLLGGHSEATILGADELDFVASIAMEGLITGTFPITEADPLIGTIETEVNTVCCTDSYTPITILLNHNLTRGQKLAQFVKRNALDFSNTARLTYNKSSELWQGNILLNGLSTQNDTHVEQWRLSFEFGCTVSPFGPTDIVPAESFWKLAINVVQKNLTTGYDDTTRLVLFYDGSLICKNSFPVEFSASFNTLTKISTPITAFTPVLYDGIGLFKSYSWVSDNPNLRLNILAKEPEPIPAGIYPELKMPINVVRGAAPIRN